MSITRRYEYFLKVVADNQVGAKNLLRITQAYHYAQKNHHNQFRKSGEPFIIHPLETAIKLAEWKMDADTIIAGLLHDTVEDTSVSVGDIRSAFGEDVAKLVSYVTKISNYSQERRRNAVDSHRDATYLRQIYISIAEDNRAVVVKLADRMHNMQTLQYVRPDRQMVIATETLNIYGELAGRLGMYEVKTELQNLAFKIIDPTVYAQLEKRVKSAYDHAGKLKRKIVSTVDSKLKLMNITAIAKSRDKSVYSVYRKINNGTPLEDIRDVVAVRFVVDRVSDCYAVLGVVHTNFTIVASAFKDYIANPKPNLYQSIHTTVVATKNAAVPGMSTNAYCEVQIRTKRMDELADYGIAAHWRYKDHDAGYTDRIAAKIKGIINDDSEGALQQVQRELRTNDMILFVAGLSHSITMPAGSTLLDLAYQVNPKRFIHFDGGTQNGAPCSFNARLQNNAEITLRWSPKETFSEKWLDYLTDESASMYVRRRAEKLADSQTTSQLNILLSSSRNSHERQLFTKRLKVLGFKAVADFVGFVRSLKLPSTLIRRMYTGSEQEFISTFAPYRPAIWEWFLSKEYVKPTGETVAYASLTFDRCCTKLPGDTIVGLMQDDVIHVHNALCPKVKEGEKMIAMSWNDERLQANPRKFRADVAIEMQWAEGLVNEIAKIITSANGSLNNLDLVRDKAARKARLTIIFYINNRFALEQIIKSISIIPQVISVHRIT